MPQDRTRQALQIFLALIVVWILFNILRSQTGLGDAWSDYKAGIQEFKNSNFGVAVIDMASRVIYWSVGAIAAFLVLQALPRVADPVWPVCWRWMFSALFLVGIPLGMHRAARLQAAAVGESPVNNWQDAWLVLFMVTGGAFIGWAALKYRVRGVQFVTTAIPAALAVVAGMALANYINFVGGVSLSADHSFVYGLAAAMTQVVDSIQLDFLLTPWGLGLLFLGMIWISRNPTPQRVG